MFCPHCGAQLEGTPKFCGVCGTQFAEGNKTVNTVQNAPRQYTGGERSKKSLLVGGAIIAIAILAVILIFFGGGSDKKGYTKLIDNYFDAVEKSDSDAILSMIPDDFVKYFEDYMGSDLTLDALDSLSPYYGNKIVSWKITSVTTIEGEELSTGLTTIGIKESRVKACYDVTVEVEFGGPDYFSTDTVEISTLKVDGKWSFLGVY